MILARHIFSGILFCVGMFCLSLSGVLADRPVESLHDLRYHVQFVGDFDSRLREVFEQVSETYRWRERRPVHTRGQLDRRVQADRDEIISALRAFGYYSPSVETSIDDARDVWRVEFAVSTGPPYLLDRVVFEEADAKLLTAVEIPDAEEFGLRPGMRIEASRVHAARTKLVDYLRDNGYPFADVALRQVVVDHRRQSAVVFFRLEPGPRAVFGDLEVEGLERVRREYVERWMPWRTGQLYQASKLNELRSAWFASGLFSLIRIEPGTELDEDGRLPIKARLHERKPRTVRFGAGYQTDTGPELKIGWLHRNFRGGGERLNFDLLFSEFKSGLEGGYLIPDLFGAGYSLQLKSGYVDERGDAYETRGWYATSRLGRQLTERLEAGGGVGYRLARINELDRRRRVGLLFFPVDLTWDSRDDILNPSRGWRMHLKMTPFLDTLDPDVYFFKTYGSAAYYLQLWAERQLVWANRLAVGMIGAESVSEVPKDERFFSGGGGSIRGYGYQSVGPRRAGVPTGGLSLVEFSSELRVRLGGRSGLALFVDGGQVYREAYPSFADDLLLGCGVGYRFFTDFGPIRGDIAIPLNRRSGIDQGVYLYVSIGQSF